VISKLISPTLFIELYLEVPNIASTPPVPTPYPNRITAVKLEPAYTVLSPKLMPSLLKISNLE